MRRHGIKDQGGDLYFAMTNTKLRLLGATAVAADFVNRRMTQSRSQRIVLFLDCCYAGAFDRGMRARASKVMDLEERFSGRGRAVITASGAVEYAFEGGALTETGDPAPSVFTTAMVRGLTTGEADRDQDGYVDLDELYDYVYDAVREVTPHQTPGKWTFGVQGDLVIARRGGPVTKPSPLPADLQDSLASPLAGVRAGAVGELARLAGGRHEGLALAARQTLADLAEDDSRTVAAAATAALARAPGTTPPERVSPASAAGADAAGPGGRPDPGPGLVDGPPPPDRRARLAARRPPRAPPPGGCRRPGAARGDRVRGVAPDRRRTRRHHDVHLHHDHPGLVRRRVGRRGRRRRQHCDVHRHPRGGPHQGAADQRRLELLRRAAHPRGGDRQGADDAVHPSQERRLQPLDRRLPAQLPGERPAGDGRRPGQQRQVRGRVRDPPHAHGLNRMAGSGHPRTGSTDLDRTPINRRSIRRLSGKRACPSPRIPRLTSTPFHSAGRRLGTARLELTGEP